MAIWYEEAWESPCYSSHASRLWHRPNSWTSNAEAHADMYINDTYRIEANNGSQCKCRILHTHERHCCFGSWLLVVELPDSDASSTKRYKYAFPIYRSPSSPVPPTSGASVWRLCTDRKIFWNLQIIEEENFKDRVSQALWRGTMDYLALIINKISIQNLVVSEIKW